MPIVVSIVLVAVGAVLVWGLEGTLNGVDVSMIGVILIAVGGIGVVASLLLSARPTSPGRVAEPRPRDPLASVEVEASPEEDAWRSPSRPPQHLP